jgi:translation initiation factor 4E
MDNIKFKDKFTFWYRIVDISLLKDKKGESQYANTVKKIADFDNVNDFWKIFQHMKKPENLQSGIEFHLFKNDIKALWEDESNEKGGRVSIKLKKDSSSLVWQEIILNFIGDNFNDKVKEEINGIVISIRKEFNFLQVWFKTYEKNNINEINKNLREILQIPNEVELDVKPFSKQNENERGYHKKNYNNYNSNYNKIGRYYK